MNFWLFQIGARQITPKTAPTTAEIISWLWVWSQRWLDMIRFIVVHHTATKAYNDDWSVYSAEKMKQSMINHWVKNRWASIAPVHWIIDAEWWSIRVNDEKIIAWAVLDRVNEWWNIHWIHIELVGDFHTNKTTKKQIDWLNDLIDDLRKKYESIESVTSHKYFQWKDCPWSNFDFCDIDFYNETNSSCYDSSDVAPVVSPTLSVPKSNHTHDQPIDKPIANIVIDDPMDNTLVGQEVVEEEDNIWKPVDLPPDPKLLRGNATVTTYYAPMPGQSRYYFWSYAKDKSINCQWDCLVPKLEYIRYKESDAFKYVACPIAYLGRKMRIESYVWNYNVLCSDIWWAITWRRIDMRVWIGEPALAHMNKYPAKVYLLD